MQAHVVQKEVENIKLDGTRTIICYRKQNGEWITVQKRLSPTREENAERLHGIAIALFGAEWLLNHI
jgi:hypothetical protein